MKHFWLFVVFFKPKASQPVTRFFIFLLLLLKMDLTVSPDRLDFTHFERRNFRQVHGAVLARIDALTVDV